MSVIKIIVLDVGSAKMKRKIFFLTRLIHYL